MNLHDLVYEKVAECLRTAREKLDNFDLHDIPVEFDIKGRIIGNAQLSSPYTVRFNQIFLEENTKHFIENIVPHEVAHIVAHYCFNDNGHGAKWKHVMKNIYNVEPRRLYTYGVSSVIRRNTKKFVYSCGCSTIFNISPIRHRRINEEGKKFVCPKCNGDIFYTGRETTLRDIEKRRQ